MGTSIVERVSPTIFYSWQADLGNSTNRGFIKDAIEKALRAIAKEGSVRDADRPALPRLDDATLGVPGAPDIAATIFAKIDQATAMVADLSIINKPSPPALLQRVPVLGPLVRHPTSRPTPNPNVLVEVGYALRALGSDALILVANTAHGPVEQLPFDLRQRRVVSYHLPANTKDKTAVRKVLVGQLSERLREILTASRPRPYPVPDLNWREYLNRSVGPVRYESTPTMLDLTGRGPEGDVVRLLEQQTQIRAGLLQPLVFHRSPTGYVQRHYESWAGGD